MKTSFLDYYKLILDKVSFEQELFRKEYRKAMNRLMDSEQDELNRWLQDRGSFCEILSRKEEFQLETMPGPATSVNK